MVTGILRWAVATLVGLVLLGGTAFQGGTALAAASTPPGRDTAVGTDLAAKLHQPQFKTAATASVVGTFPSNVTAADFTGDGKPDLAVVVDSASAVPGLVVVPGNGKGAFKDRIDVTLPGNAHGCDVATGDLNGDGKADLAVATCRSSGAQVLLMTGRGDGTFDVAQTLPNSSSQPHVAIGDLNGDGKADVAVAREQGPLSVYFGKGDGMVGSATDYPGIGTDSIDAVDVTGDGLLDLSLPGPSTMVNKGGGVFAQPVGSDFFALASALADLDGDGILDGAGVDASGRHVLIGHGSGDGRYHLTQTVTLDVQQTLSIAGGDFDGDGTGDFIVNGDRQLVYLLTGTGDGHVASPVGYATGTDHLTAVDLGGSAATDLASLTDDPGTVYGVLGGSKSLGAPTLIANDVAGETALGDLDGDGRLDVLTAGVDIREGSPFQDGLAAHLTRGKGRLGPSKFTYVRDESASSGVAALKLADVNGDGKLDVVGGFENFQFNPNNLFVSLGKGNGTFGSALLLTTGDTGTDVLDLAVGDITGDGELDIVANTNGAISVLPGKGDGTFKTPILSGSAGAEITNTMLGDVTGDGKTDVVVTIVTGNEDFSSSDLVVEKGDSKGHFTEVQSVTVDTNIFGAVLADLNGDSRPDLGVVGRGGTNGGKGGLYVLLDSVGGSLQSPVYYPYGGTLLVGADFNLDGTIDLATNVFDTYTDVGANRGDGTLVFGPRIVTPSGPAAAGDVNGDKAPDLVTQAMASPRAIGLTLNRP